MHSRSRVWIITIILLFVGSFLLAFQPVRRPPREVVPEASFEFAFDQPIAQHAGEYEAKAKEIQEALVAGGFNKEDLELVQVVDKQRVKIKTYALDQNQMAEDEKNLLKALQAKYKGVRAVGRQEVSQAVEQPLYQLGNVLAIYRPTPKVKLGLDLQGGLHVVLRCLPYASMVLTTKEESNQALYAVEKPKDTSAEGEQKAKAEGTGKPEQEGAAKAEPSKPTGPSITREELEKRVLVELVRSGLVAQQDVEKGYVKVNAVSPYRLLIQTNAPDERRAAAQRSVVLKMLQEMYPSYTIDPGELETIKVESDTADKVKNIIDRRLFAMGEIREPVIQKQGADQIIVQIPGVKEPDRVASILKSTALLEFRLIPAQYDNANPGEDTYDEWKDKRTGEIVSWERVLAESRASTDPESDFKGSDLLPNSRVVPGSSASSWEVTFELKANRKRAFHEFTRRNVGRRMAIVLDNKCQMAPVIESPIPGQGIIRGNFSLEEAGDLRLLLNAGALPVPLEIAENRTVSATLGQDTVARSLRAGLIGLLAVVVFMVFYYRVPGVLADIALLLYVLVVLAVVAVSQQIKGVGGITLTLPGIAGVIISIGMAVDANVLIFERLKEELRSGKSMRASVAAGFDRAWTAIVDSNVTTLITCAVLYFLGTSLIKSFAAMLFIGVVCSFFTAVTVSRWLVTMVSESRLGQDPRLFGVSPDEIR